MSTVKNAHAAPSPLTPAVRTRRRWLRWLVVGALLAGVVLARRPLLRLAACPLITRDSGAEARWLVPLDSEEAFDHVAGSCRSDPEARILLIERAPNRLQVLGVVPSWAEGRRHILLARGVPAEAVEVLPGATESDWDQARVLRGWLEEHPGAHVAVFGDRFHSRRQRIVLDRVLGPEAGRAHVVAVSDGRYDEMNWWQVKAGLVGWWEGITSLGYVCLAGEGDGPAPPWDPDLYERGLP
jgi:hypothetical protein